MRDLVEVVRCEHCKYLGKIYNPFAKEMVLFCEYGEVREVVASNHYCGYGDKKEDNSE